MNRIDQLFRKKILGASSGAPTDQDLAEFEKLLKPKRKNRWGFFFLMFCSIALLSAAAWSVMKVSDSPAKARSAFGTQRLTKVIMHDSLLTSVQMDSANAAGNAPNTEHQKKAIVHLGAEGDIQPVDKQHNSSTVGSYKRSYVFDSMENVEPVKVNSVIPLFAPDSLLQVVKLSPIGVGPFRNFLDGWVFPFQSSLVMPKHPKEHRRNMSIAIGISPQRIQMQSDLGFGVNSLDTVPGKWFWGAHALISKSWKRWEGRVGLAFMTSKKDVFSEEVEYGYFYQRKDPLGSVATEDFDEELFEKLNAHYSVRELSAWSVPLSIGYRWWNKPKFHSTVGLGGQVSRWAWSILTYESDERTTETNNNDVFESYSSFFGRPELVENQQITFDPFLYSEWQWKWSESSALAIEPQMGWNRISFNPRLPSIPTVRYGLRFSYVFRF